MDQLKPGLRGHAELVVGPEHTAIHFGSGAIEVFATPMMIALMEKAAVAAVEHLLPEGMNSLGVHLDVSHNAATPLGARVTATAELISIDGRRLEFKLWAEDEHEKIGEGRHTRIAVKSADFEARVAEKAKSGAQRSG